MATSGRCVSRGIRRHEVALSRSAGQGISIQLDLYTVGEKLAEMYPQMKVMLTAVRLHAHFAELHTSPVFGHCSLPIKNSRGRFAR